MAVNAHQTVVGVFDERGLADKAVDDLQNAGFSSDEIYYAGSGENPDTNFWQGIKSLFTRDKTTRRDHDLAEELRNLGFSDDEIRHYQNEYDIGRTIVAVKAPGREEQVLEILRVDGAHN